MKLHPSARPILAALTFAMTLAAHATSFTWDANGSTSGTGGTGDWDTSSYFWDAGVNQWPSSGTDNDAIFGGTTGAVTLTSDITVNDLTFNITGYTLAGAYSVTLNGSTPTINIATGLSTTIGNNTATVIASSDGLRKAGSGTLILNGSAVNTVTGGLSVNAGTLTLDFANLGTPTNLIDSGNALILGGGTLGITGKSGAFTTSQTFVGLTLNSGASAISLNSNGGTATNLVLNTITRDAGGTLNFTSPVTGSISTSNSNTNGILGTWASVGSGTSTQYATVSSGNISALTGTAATDGAGLTDTTGTVNYDLGTFGGTVQATVSANTIRYTGVAGTTAPGTTSFTVNGLMNAGSGLWTVGSTNKVTIGGQKELVVNTASSDITISSIIADNAVGVASDLTKSGTGTLTLSGANTYTGTTTINGGTLVVKKLKATGTNTKLIINDGGTLDIDNNLNNVRLELSSLDMTGGTVTGNAYVGSVHWGLTTPTINIHANATPSTIDVERLFFLGGGLMTFNVDTDAQVNVGGSVVNGNLVVTQLAKAGPGTLTLNGTNTYTGLTTVSGGKLVIGASGTINGGTNGVSIAGGELNYNSSTALSKTVSFATSTTGGRLSGTGTITNAVTVTTGNTVAPGTSGTGTLSTGALTLNGTYACQLDGANCDKLAVTGSLTLTGATLAISTVTAPTAASYVIATYTGAVPAFTTVTGMPSGYFMDTATAGEIKLVKTTGFSSWIAKLEFGLAPADQDPTDDPDGDGLNNLMEYALAGHNPALADGSGGSLSGRLVSFAKRPEAAADSAIGYRIEESDDLGLTDGWAEVSEYTANNATLISYTLPADKATVFARLRVVQTP